MIGALALLLPATMQSCKNDDDDIKKNSNSILEDVKLDSDTIKSKTIVMSFDKFENQNVPEVTIASPDTTVLMVKKSFLTRRNEEIKDTMTYIVVWDKPNNRPFVTKVTDAEDAGDEIKVMVRHAEYSEVLPAGSYDLAVTPYINPNESSRNADGTINADFYTEDNGIIHPVAFFVENDGQDLQKSDDGMETVHNLSQWNVGLVENLAQENASVDNKVNLKFNIQKLKKEFKLAEGSWGKISAFLGINELSLQAVEGFHVQFDAEATYGKILGIPYPNGVDLKDFSIFQYGTLTLTGDCGVGVNVLLEKGHQVPATCEYYTKPQEQDPEDFDDDDLDDEGVKEYARGDMDGNPQFNKIENGFKSLEDQYIKLNGDKNTNGNMTNDKAKIICGHKIPILNLVFCVGPIPLWLTVDGTPEIRFYPPKVNATAEVSLYGKYSTSYSAGFGWAADNKRTVKLGNGSSIKLKEGFHGYTSTQTTEKTLKLKAGLSGAATSKVGVFFVVQASLMKCVSANVALGCFARATVSGEAKGFEYDLLTDKPSYSSLNANIGACVDFGVGGEVGATLSAFGLKTLASTKMELLLLDLPIWKGMYITQTGIAYDGVLSGETENQDLIVKIKDKENWKYEWLPNTLGMSNSFMRADKLEITLPEMTIDGVKIPETVFTGVDRTINADKGHYENINATKSFNYDGKEITVTIKDGFVKNNGTLVVTNYYDLSFDLEVTIDGETHTYKFETVSSKY